MKKCKDCKHANKSMSEFPCRDCYIYYIEFKCDYFDPKQKTPDKIEKLYVNTIKQISIEIYENREKINEIIDKLSEREE